jgi:hypothetical protein
MQELFEKLIREQITPNSFYVLYSLFKKTKPTDIVNSNLEITRLKNAGWLGSNLEITDKSIIFIEEISGYFRKSKKKSAHVIMGPDSMNNITSYNDWETIFNATRRYVNEYSENGFDYMSNSQYFVRKQSLDKTFESKLANYCEMIINNIDHDSPRFKERYV